MTYIVGLTGGLGTGKSTVAAFFHELGIEVIDADVIARECVNKDSKALTQIKDHFGEQILTPKGELNRTLLREKIFTHFEDKRWLEQLLHPEIYARIRQKIRDVRSAYCIVVIPLLTENFENYKDLLDIVLVVDATTSQQIERTAVRDKTQEVLIKKMILAQASREARLKIAHHILVNDGSIEDLKEKVNTLHQQFLEKSRAKV